MTFGHQEAGYRTTPHRRCLSGGTRSGFVTWAGPDGRGRPWSSESRGQKRFIYNRGLLRHFLDYVCQSTARPLFHNPASNCYSRGQPM